jgi:heme-degrading monooxygenase HmoA
VIAREWKCTLPRRHRDGFMEHLYATGVAEISALPGYRGYQILERELPYDVAEVTLVTYWGSLEDIKAFAGEDIGVAVLYPGDEVYELVPETVVRHYGVVGAAWPTGKE